MPGASAKGRAWRSSFALLAALSLGTLPADRQATAQDASSQSREAADPDLEQSLAILRRQIGDSTLGLAQRESIARELAATLDNAAQTAKTPDSQRQWWDQAVAALDDFERQNPAHPQHRSFRLQAAVYRWAIARSLRHQADLNPTKPELREETIAELDDAVSRFRAIPSPTAADGNSIESNLKFRFAQALADRSDLEDDLVRKAQFEAEAKTLLEGTLAEPSIQGFARLLKGELLRRERQFDAALVELTAAAKAMPPPPERQLVSVRSSVLAALRRYDDAIRLIKESHIEAPAKQLMTVQVLLAQRGATAADTDRYPIESRLFEEMTALKAVPGPESRTAILALAHAGIEPDPRLGPSAWDLLADAQEAAGDPIRASGLSERAAVRAEDSGNPEQAGGYRLKAGALLFRAGRFLEAGAVLSRVIRLQGAENAEVRAKANLLRALALGRAVATNLPGASAAAYKEALEAQIKDYPDDPNTDEARWLLGDLALAAGDRDRASQLWSAVGVKSPRWLNSRRAIAAIDRAELVNGDLGREPAKFAQQFQRAGDFLDQSIREAPNEAASTELLLERAWLDVSPESRMSDDAREITDRVARSSITNSQRFRADLIRIIAMAQLGRYVESELIARRLAESPENDEPAAFLEAVRLLDRTATVAESDLRQRRFGLLMRMLLTPALARDTSRLPVSQVAELRMRLTRGLVFMGDSRAAKASLAAWNEMAATKSWNDGLLRDLADTYARLNAHELAIDVQRLRLGSLISGSTAWFDAKYAMALALYRAGQTREAQKLIDATAILHPDLGGGPLKEKFIRLRQRLGDGP